MRITDCESSQSSRGWATFLSGNLDQLIVGCSPQSLDHMEGVFATGQVRRRDDPASIPKFVDEAVRCFGTANSVRIVRRDRRRFDIDYREGDMVLSALPISGRDDRENKDPDRFDIDRQGNVSVRHGFRIGMVHAIESLPLRWDVVTLPQE